MARTERAKETEVAWRVTADEVKARSYNLDFKNPHTIADEHGDPEELLGKSKRRKTTQPLCAINSRLFSERLC